MSNGPTTLPEEVKVFIRECIGKEHSESYLIAALQRLQNQVGYLSNELLEEVAQLMQVPAARVYGVATFYHFFNFTPKGKTRITVCMGTACYVRGADKVFDRLRNMLGIEEGQTTPDGLFSLEGARCIGACAMAPVIVINEQVYGNVTPEQLPSLLKKYGYTAKARASAA
jgi:NADH-quinone oxidoreductase E subunit